MTFNQQIWWWGAALVLLTALLWLLADALLPFVLGAAIAYLTDPLADRLQRLGLSRLMATIVITIGSLGIFALGIFLVVPLLIEQVRDLIAAAPGWIDQAQLLLRERLPELNISKASFRENVAEMGKELQDWGIGLFRGALAGGVAVFGFVTILLLTPVVAFYLLMDWDRLIQAIDDYLPREHLQTIRGIASDLDRALSGFVRGQLTVCVILGTFYAVGLMLVGLKFGLLIGLFAGLISFIPFLGSIIGGVLSIGVALAQFWGDWIWLAAVVGIFVTGQLIEGNYLTPKLVGDKVGLHPVWLMFALSAFGVLFGFVGLLVAVPAAAAIGVIGRFLLEQYQAGPLYHGTFQQPSAEDALAHRMPAHPERKP